MERVWPVPIEHTVMKKGAETNNVAVVRYHMQPRNGPDDNEAVIHNLGKATEREARDVMEFFIRLLQRWRVSLITHVIDLAEKRDERKMLDHLNLFVSFGFRFAAIEYLAATDRGPSVRLRLEKCLGETKESPSAAVTNKDQKQDDIPKVINMTSERKAVDVLSELNAAIRSSDTDIHFTAIEHAPSDTATATCVRLSYGI